VQGWEYVQQMQQQWLYSWAVYSASRQELAKFACFVTLLAE
jgi:hypothetical protein